MESFISDKDAMDPEVVIPEGVTPASPTPAVSLALWVGLPRSWALAVFLGTGAAVFHWGPQGCIVGLVVAAILACIRGNLSESESVQITGASTWLSILHHCCSLAALAAGLRSTLQYMGGARLRHWVITHIAHSPSLFSTAVLAFVTLLFVLGLGRSRLLRSGLMGGMSTTLLLLILGSVLFYKPVLLQQLFQMQFSLNQVVESVAFFTLIFSGTMEKSTVQKQLVQSSFSAVFAMVVSCLLAVIFLALVVDKETSNTGVLLISALEVHSGEESRSWRLVRDGVAILATLTLSLSLVEVMALGQRSVAAVAGHILPVHVARDNLWTGTQLLAITVIGLASSVLVCLNSLTSLLTLSSVSYLLAHSCDVICAVYHLYQPSFKPRHPDDGEGGGSYQLLTGLVDNEDELSDDSGHSSDTDIDAIVDEYKETIRVVTAAAEPVTEPTVRTARRATYSLAAILLASIGLGVSLALGYHYLPLFCVLEVVVFTLVLSYQPQKPDTPHLSPWQACITLSLNIGLATLIVSPVWLPLLSWCVLGLLFGLYQQRRKWVSWQASLRGHADRARLCSVHHRTSLSFLPSYHKLTHIDTVHIVR